MSRRVSLSIFLFGWSAVANLFAQPPAKPGGALPSPTLPVTSPPSPTPSIKSLVDTMDLADLKEAIQLLKNNYIKPETLDETELSRATFEGILTRLGRGVVLLSSSAAGPSEPAAPFFGEILEDHIGYLRFGALVRQNLEALDTNLKTFGTKVDAVVIDLRASPAAGDFAAASEFAKRFCPKGMPLFSLRKTTAKQERTFTSDRDPSYQGLTIVLVDGDTAGVAEAIAGAIHICARALVIGQPTAGRAVDYTDLKLPSGRVLRVAVSEAVLPENRPLFPDGLQPDLPVEMPAADKREVFQQSQEKGMTPFVVENERPHLNEAALISGKNPELEAMEAAQQRRGHGPEKPMVHDPVLQRALDVVTSITIFQRR
jgi:C-terminal processing protease CtpA/Prc